jgi:hypothetical protein
MSYSKGNNNKKCGHALLCKVCLDNGLPEVRYTSHNVRGKDGKVCCPVLLRNPCDKCGMSGHTTRDCRRSVESTRTIVKVEPRKPVSVSKVTVAVNLFDALNSDNESDSDSEQVELKPVVKPKIAKIAMKNRNWGEMDSDDEEECDLEAMAVWAQK